MTQSDLPIQATALTPDILPDRFTRFGLLALTTDLTTERDLAAGFGGSNIVVHTARLPYKNPTTPENLRAILPNIAVATQQLPEAPLAGVLVACTSATIVLTEAEIVKAVKSARADVDVITPPAAILESFADLGAKKIAMITPYLRETAILTQNFLSEQGISFSDCQYFDMADDTEMARLSENYISDAVAQLNLTGADAVFISCTALPAMDVITRLERETGLPVVSSNAALLYAMGKRSGQVPTTLAATQLGKCLKG